MQIRRIKFNISPPPVEKLENTVPWRGGWASEMNVILKLFFSFSVIVKLSEEKKIVQSARLEPASALRSLWNSSKSLRFPSQTCVSDVWVQPVLISRACTLWPDTIANQVHVIIVRMRKWTMWSHSKFSFSFLMVRSGNETTTYRAGCRCELASALLATPIPDTSTWSADQSLQSVQSRLVCLVEDFKTRSSFPSLSVRKYGCQRTLDQEPPRSDPSRSSRAAVSFFTVG